LYDPEKILRRSIKTGEYPIERLRSHVARRDFSEHRPEIRRQSKIASLIQLLLLEARPPSVDLAALHITANNEQRAGVTVIRSAVAVLARHAAELRHRHDDDIVHAIAEVGDESSDRA